MIINSSECQKHSSVSRHWPIKADNGSISEKTNVELSCIFKLSQCGNRRAMEDLLMRRSRTRIKWPDTGSKTFHNRNQSGAYTEQCANQRPWNVSEIHRLVAMAGEITISNMKLNFELKNWSDYQQGQLYEGEEFITRVTMQPEPAASSDQMSATNQWAKHFTYGRAEGCPLNSLSWLHSCNTLLEL